MEQNPGVRDVINLFFKHKRKIVTIFCLAAAASYGVSKTIPRPYIAKAVIMVNPGRESTPLAEVGETRPPALTPETIINTEMQLIAGRELTRKVVAAIGVDNLYPRLPRNDVPANRTQELAVIEFSENLKVQNVSKSNLIEVDFQHENPYIAAKALSALVEGLKDRHLQVFSRLNSGFLEEQLESVRGEAPEFAACPGPVQAGTPARERRTRRAAGHQASRCGFDTHPGNGQAG